MMHTRLAVCCDRAQQPTGCRVSAAIVEDQHVQIRPLAVPMNRFQTALQEFRLIPRRYDQADLDRLIRQGMADAAQSSGISDRLHARLDTCCRQMPPQHCAATVARNAIQRPGLGALATLTQNARYMHDAAGFQSLQDPQQQTVQRCRAVVRFEAASLDDGIESAGGKAVHQ
jgi:hypothetical protein